jgi:octanoyl-[GcvH]:protein N-octanoyltransferase
VTERRSIRLLRDSFPAPPEMDTALSHATLRLVAAGRLPETLRVHRPGPIVAFGPRDRVAPGFGEAVAAAGRSGFGAVERLAGGRAAVFHEGTIAFSWAIPEPNARDGIRPRFDRLAGIMVGAFLALGVDARIGEIPGEYCPGEHSINARGKTKLMGVGQRIIDGAAHVGGVIVVSGSDRVRDVLIPVYRALDLDWDPATTGSLEDEVPGVTWDRAREAVVEAFSRRFEVVPAGIGDREVALARNLVPRHAVSHALPGDGGDRR